MKKTGLITFAFLGTFNAASVLACASCGCSISSDWSVQGLSGEGGWSMDLRYDFLNQNQLRSGTGTISSAAAAAATNTQTGAPAEVEQYTRNNYLTATFDYNNGSAWGVSLSLPYIERSHATLGTGSDGTTFDPANGAYTSSGAGIGDVRVLGRFFGFSEHKNFGLQLGLKLPTGSKGQNSGFGSAQAVDPGLQRGTGTTDLLLGAYYFDNLTADWDYFVQGAAQAALDHSTMAAGSYKPGSSLNLNAGIRYRSLDAFIPTLQLNARTVRRDSGVAADTYATGGSTVYLTPGAIVQIDDRFSAYANLQIPVYQNLNGIQIAPRLIVSVGGRYTF